MTARRTVVRAVGVKGLDIDRRESFVTWARRAVEVVWSKGSVVVESESVFVVAFWFSVVVVRVCWNWVRRVDVVVRRVDSWVAIFGENFYFMCGLFWGFVCELAR